MQFECIEKHIFTGFSDYIAHEIDKQNLQSVNHIPGIHDNGRVVTSDFNSI